MLLNDTPGTPSAIGQMLQVLMAERPAGVPGQEMPKPVAPMTPPFNPHASPMPQQGVQQQPQQGGLRGLLSNMLGGEVPAEYANSGLLSPDEIRQAKPGIWNRIAGKDAYRNNLNNIMQMKQVAGQAREQQRVGEIRKNAETLFAPKANETPQDVQARISQAFAYFMQHGDTEMMDRLKGVMANLVQTQAPQERNPVVGSEAWKEAERFKASLRPAGGDDRVMVPVQQPDGSVVYTPRSQAAGQNVPSPSKGGAPISKQVAENQTQMAVIDKAIRELSANPQAVGLKRGVGALPGLGKVGDMVNQRADPKGVTTRALLSNIGSLVINQRSGAAVSIAEFDRLAPFVPQVTDPPEAAKKKLEQLKEILKQETDLLATSAGRQKASVPSFEEWKASKQK